MNMKKDDAFARSRSNAGLESLCGMLATDNPPVRYEHVCEDCKIEFSNVVKHSPVCCVCMVGRARSEW